MQLLDELYECQRSKVQELGETLVPNLTSDDVLQPMDFAELEENPAFRFEEGVLSGIGEARAALRAFFVES